MEESRTDSLDSVVQDLLRRKKLRRSLLGGFSRASVWETLLEIMRTYRTQVDDAQRECRRLERRVQELQQGYDSSIAALRDATQALNACTAAKRRTMTPSPSLRGERDTEDRQ